MRIACHLGLVLLLPVIAACSSGRGKENLASSASSKYGPRSIDEIYNIVPLEVKRGGSGNMLAGNDYQASSSEYTLTQNGEFIATLNIQIAKGSSKSDFLFFGGGLRSTILTRLAIKYAHSDVWVTVPAVLAEHCHNPLVRRSPEAMLSLGSGTSNSQRPIIIQISGGDGGEAYSVSFVFYPFGFGFVIPPERFSILTAPR
jgi:hypothetical protein